MKKLVVLLFALALSLPGTEIEWAEDYRAALAKAQKEGKPILVLVTSERCRWCRKLESTTLQEDEVVRKIEERFVAVHVTKGKDYYPDNIVQKMKRNGIVPRSFFLNSQGVYAFDMPGYWNVEDYLSILDDAKRALLKLDKRMKKQNELRTN